MSFANELVAVAKNELALWTNGGWVECVLDPNTQLPISDQKKQPGAVRVFDYWREGVGENNRHGCIKLAWSAAFICWCLRKSGMKIDQFPFSGSHQTYIRWAINNTKANKPGKSYYAQRVTQYLPKPGDLIAQWRKEKKSDPNPDITFDHQPDEFYLSHCDIVVDVMADKVVTVGGNVSDKVKTTNFAISNGVLAPKDQLICILQCKM
jgi:hypothetical protein